MNNKASHDLSHIDFAGQPSPRQTAMTAKIQRLSLHNTSADVPQEVQTEFLVWLMNLGGLDAAAYRPGPLLRRLPACLRAMKVNSLPAVRELLEAQPAKASQLLNLLLIGATEFFREPSVFETLRTQILLPAAAAHQGLRVWSAACSTGAELYSIAILLQEAQLLEQSYLLGTDCRGDATACAQIGQYDVSLLRSMPSSMRERYFESVGSAWQLSATLRRHVHWHEANLLTGVEAGPWDIILWRNVAIYLQFQAAAGIFRQLTAQLAPQGVLIVGKADRPPCELGLTQVDRCIYRSKDRSITAIDGSNHNNRSLHCR